LVVGFVSGKDYCFSFFLEESVYILVTDVIKHHCTIETSHRPKMAAIFVSALFLTKGGKFLLNAATVFDLFISKLFLVM